MNATHVSNPLLRLAVLVLLASPALARQEHATDSKGSWSWRVAPYFWTAGIDGTVTTPNAEVDMEVDFGDIWDNLESAGLLFVEARKDRLAVLGDLVYLGLEVDGETPAGADADVELDTTILQLAGLYRLSPTSAFELGGGARYTDFDTELSAGVVNSSSDRSAFDGFAAGRGTWCFGQRWSLQVYGDVGAGDSDLTWQASTMLGFSLGSWGLGLGYRMLDYDFEEGSNELDLTFEGLVYGVEFNF